MKHYELPIVILAVLTLLGYICSPLMMSPARAQALLADEASVQTQQVFAQYTNSIAGPGYTYVPYSQNTNVYSWSFTNLSSSTDYVHFYNLARTPVVGTDAPVITIPVPATSTVNYALPAGQKFKFKLGIAWTVTLGYLPTDATHCANGDTVGFYTWRQ